MSHKFKNILIGILIAVIAVLLWMLYIQSYGRYCRPVIKEIKSPPPGAYISLPLFFKDDKYQPAS